MNAFNSGGSPLSAISPTSRLLWMGRRKLQDPSWHSHLLPLSWARNTCYLPIPRWPLTCLGIASVHIQETCPNISLILSATTTWFFHVFMNVSEQKYIKYVFFSKLVLNLAFNSVCFSKYIFSYIKWIFLHFSALWFCIWRCKDNNIHVGGVYSVYWSTLSRILTMCHFIIFALLLSRLL